MSEVNVVQLCVFAQLGATGTVCVTREARKLQMTLTFSHGGKEPQVSEWIKRTITANFVSCIEISAA